jgi:uncharacterized protein (DUF1499 family)
MSDNDERDSSTKRHDRPQRGLTLHSARSTRSFAVLAVALALFSLSCSGTRPVNLGVVDQRLAPCPASPNCVASDALDIDQRIDAFVLTAPAQEVWAAAVADVKALPRTVIVRSTNHYLHAECSSRVIRYVDDLELHLQPKAGIIAVRSASRLGHSDLGVNRRRVEGLREKLAEAGLIESP